MRVYFASDCMFDSIKKETIRKGSGNTMKSDKSDMMNKRNEKKKNKNKKQKNAIVSHNQS
jgi:hypothetical protein